LSENTKGEDPERRVQTSEWRIAIAISSVYNTNPTIIQTPQFNCPAENSEIHFLSTEFQTQVLIRPSQFFLVTAHVK